MSWSDFWRSLEQLALPRVKQELANLGWKLTDTKPWTAKPRRNRQVAAVEVALCRAPWNANRLCPDEVTAESPEQLVERVAWVEEHAKKGVCCEGECPECAGVP